MTTRLHLLKVLIFITACAATFTTEARTELTSATFDFTATKDRDGVLAVTPKTAYTDSLGYGWRNGYFTLAVPDGSYRVTVTYGNRRKAGELTLRAESRRLFVENAVTAKKEIRTEVFTVNKRTPAYTDEKGRDARVRIKKREEPKLNWDDYLTFEVGGGSPLLQRLEIAPADTSVTHVYLCGNSTVVDQDYEPWASWGQMVTRFFDEDVCVVNCAESGETAQSFISQGRLAQIVSRLKAGDYIFMEFGHNDQKTDGNIGNGAFYSFQQQLKVFVDYARKVGAHPVFCTPTRRRMFDSEGKIRDTHLDYPEAMRFMAEREGIPCIDLQESTRVMFEAWGPETSKHAFVHYSAGCWPGQDNELADDTHFNAFGAYQIALLVLQGIVDLDLPLAKHIKAGFPGIDPENPADWQQFKYVTSLQTEALKPDGN
ncbi:MAG: rhamnogalacturonan acetylesterase [Bacteroidales bacterium]|nr:rhamnogalacturonan acetylesterase [Candidatus Liminaster caballi]